MRFTMIGSFQMPPGVDMEDKELVLENGSVVHFSPAPAEAIRGSSEENIKLSYDQDFIQLWGRYPFEFDE